MKKRIISLLLAVMMIVGMLPMTALAEEAVVDEAVCDHAATTETITPNNDGTHTVKDVCDECGETVLVLDEPTKIDIDLEGVIAAAAAGGMAVYIRLFRFRRPAHRREGIPHSHKPAGG